MVAYEIRDANRCQSKRHGGIDRVPFDRLGSPLIREISDTKRIDDPATASGTGPEERKARMGKGKQMMGASSVSDRASTVLDALDVNRAVELVQEVCRIPSVLGEEGELAAFLASVMSGVRLRGRAAAARSPRATERGRARVLRRWPDRGAHRAHGHEAGLARMERDGAVLRFAHRRRGLRPRRHGHEGGLGVSDRRDRGGAGVGVAARRAR